MLRGVFIATQLNSTSSCRHVHMQREQLSPISSERSDPVDSVCRSWRHKQKHDWLGCTLFNWVTWVELCRYKHPFIRRRRRSIHPPDTTPLVITPFSAAVGHRRTEPGGYFCWKLTLLTRSSDSIRPTRRDPDLNRPTNGRKQGGLWARGVCPGSFGRTPPETVGDSRTKFNRILCTSKSEAAVTSNKKLRCRYVEADYR